MSNTNDPESIQFLRTAESHPLGVAEETAHRRVEMVAASLGKLEAERRKRGLLNETEKAAQQEQERQIAEAVAAAGVSPNTHFAEVVALAQRRALEQGRMATDAATAGADVVVLYPQFGASGEEYQNAA